MDPTGHVDCTLLDGGGDTAACNTARSAYQDTTVHRLWVEEDETIAVQWYGNTEFAFGLSAKNEKGLSIPSYSYSQGFHGGIDQIAEPGTEVYAGVYGIVRYIDGGAYRPRYIKIEIGPDTYLIVGHLAPGKNWVIEGQIVTPDTIIGRVSSEGEHIHAEFWSDKSGVDIKHPFDFLSEESKNGLIRVADTMLAGDPRISFHSRSDGQWQTTEDQPTLRYGSTTNLNEGQPGYTNPWPSK